MWEYTGSHSGRLKLAREKRGKTGVSRAEILRHSGQIKGLILANFRVAIQLQCSPEVTFLYLEEDHHHRMQCASHWHSCISTGPLDRIGPCVWMKHCQGAASSLPSFYSVHTYNLLLSVALMNSQYLKYVKKTGREPHTHPPPRNKAQPSS